MENQEQQRVTVLGATGMLGGMRTFSLREWRHGVTGLSRKTFHIGVTPLDQFDLR